MKKFFNLLMKKLSNQFNDHAIDLKVGKRAVPMSEKPKKLKKLVEAPKR